MFCLSIQRLPKESSMELCLLMNWTSWKSWTRILPTTLVGETFWGVWSDGSFPACWGLLLWIKSFRQREELSWEVCSEVETLNQSTGSIKTSTWSSSAIETHNFRSKRIPTANNVLIAETFTFPSLSPLQLARLSAHHKKILSSWSIFWLNSRVWLLGMEMNRIKINKHFEEGNYWLMTSEEEKKSRIGVRFFLLPFMIVCTAQINLVDEWFRQKKNENPEAS